MSTPPYRITFDPAAFIVEYPEFASVSTARLQAMFNQAQAALLDNTGGSPVTDDNVLRELFNMLVAHLLTLFGAAPTSANSRPPGRLASAAEGTVSSSFEFKLPEGSAIAPWYNQTQYGAMFWMATARYRSARYFASGGTGIGTARAYGQPTIQIPGGV